MVDFERSASTVTMRGSRAARSRSASPNAARLALPIIVLQPAQLLDERTRGGVGAEVIGPRGLGHAEDLADGGDGFGGLGRLAVPLDVVLHERHALALHGVGHDE